ncbi:hypothetical protein BH11PLA2_BH11PLA2_01780 [soil metagenome]
MDDTALDGFWHFPVEERVAVLLEEAERLELPLQRGDAVPAPSGKVVAHA